MCFKTCLNSVNNSRSFSFRYYLVLFSSLLTVANLVSNCGKCKRKAPSQVPQWWNATVGGEKVNVMTGDHSGLGSHRPLVVEGSCLYEVKFLAGFTIAGRTASAGTIRSVGCLTYSRALQHLYPLKYESTERPRVFSKSRSSVSEGVLGVCVCRKWTVLPLCCLKVLYWNTFHNFSSMFWLNEGLVEAKGEGPSFCWPNVTVWKCVV